jgi:hypothetical protein
MNFFRLVSAALLFSAVLCRCPFVEAQENPQEPKQTIRVGVDRVNVGVIVTDHSGHFVEGLRRKDFRVLRQLEKTLSSSKREPCLCQAELCSVGTTAALTLAGDGRSRISSQE